MKPVQSEQDGINNFVSAFENYFYDAEASVAVGTPGVAVAPGTLEGASSSMALAMIGISSVGASLSIGNGITAFWNVVIASAALIWPMTPPIGAATPPPGLAIVGQAVNAAGIANITTNSTIYEATERMASAIHPLNLGGTVTNTAPTPVTFQIS